MLKKWVLVSAIFAFTVPVWAADSTGARAFAAAKFAGRGTDKTAGKTFNQDFSTNQILDVQGLLALDPVQVETLSITAASATPVTFEVIYMGNQIYPAGSAVTLSPQLTTYPIPVYAPVPGANVLRIKVDGAFTLGSVSVTYMPITPTPPPTPAIPTCVLSGNGNFAGNPYFYLISTNGSVVYGTDDFNTFTQQVSTFLTAGVCMMPQPPNQNVCSEGGFGAYRGFPSWNYRLNINGVTFDATMDFPTFQSRLTIFRSMGLCVTQNTSACQILGAGKFNGQDVNHILGIGTTVVDGLPDVDTATARMLALRDLGLCK